MAIGSRRGGGLQTLCPALLRKSSVLATWELSGLLVSLLSQLLDQVSLGVTSLAVAVDALAIARARNCSVQPKKAPRR